MNKFILRDEKIRQLALLALLELKIGDPLAEVVIRPYRKDRSLEQNAFMWRMHQVASQEIGHSVDELHYYCCARFLGTKAIMINDKFLSVPYTTTCGPEGKKLNVAEMNKFLIEVETFYVAQGVRLDKVTGHGSEEQEKTDHERRPS